MNLKNVIKQFEYYRPTSEKQVLLKCEVPLEYLASGAFRNVYTVPGLPIVVKIPSNPGGRRHAQEEIRFIKDLMKNTLMRERMQRYLPVTYYMNLKSGVSVAHKYSMLRDTSNNERMTQKVAQKVSDILEIGEWDSHVYNFGRDERGRVVVLDFGCM